MSNLKPTKLEKLNWRQSDQQVSSAVADEFVLMGLKNSLYYGLKDTAGRIWQLLETAVSVDDIVKVLLQEYDVDEAACRRDVTQFLQKLASESLITAVE